jgi:hypothetical protein
VTTEHLHLSWRSVAIGSLLLNLVAVAAVTSVAAANDADALSTVALSLAVIAFVCQLLVYTVQTWQSGEQLRSAETLNRETLGVLAEARVRIESTHHMVESHQEQMIRLVLNKEDRERLKETQGKEVIAARVDPVIVTHSLSPAPISRDADELPETSPESSESPLSDDALRVLESPPLAWPSQDTEEEARRVLAILEDIPVGDSARFNHAVGISDYVASAVRGSSPGLQLYQSDQPIIEAGLMEEVDPTMDDGKTVRRVAPTEAGLLAGALLVAPWPPPAFLADVKERIWKQREVTPEEALTDLDRYRNRLVRRRQASSS